MNKQWHLYTEYPKRRKTPHVGVLSIGKDGHAHFFDGMGEQYSQVLAEMTNARILWAAADGIMLSGMHPKGHDKAGRQEFFYQEWFLRYA